MAGLAETVAWLKDFGIYDFFLPFIISFAIFYGLLAKTKVFGDPEKKPARTINIVISLTAAAYIMIFTPAGVTISSFLAGLFGKTTILVLGLLAFLIVFYLMMNILQPGAEWNWTRWGWAILLIAVILGIGVFISSGGATIFPGIKTPIQIALPNAEILALIVVIILTGLVIYFLATGEGGERKVRIGPT